jgi:hypothetical protein
MWLLVQLNTSARAREARRLTPLAELCGLGCEGKRKGG